MVIYFVWYVLKILIQMMSLWISWKDWRMWWKIYSIVNVSVELLDKTEKIIGIIKFDNTKILIDTNDKLPMISL